MRRERKAVAVAVERRSKRDDKRKGDEQRNGDNGSDGAAPQEEGVEAAPSGEERDVDNGTKQEQRLSRGDRNAAAKHSTEAVVNGAEVDMSP